MIATRDESRTASLSSARSPRPTMTSYGRSVDTRIRTGCNRSLPSTPGLPAGGQPSHTPRLPGGTNEPEGVEDLADDLLGRAAIGGHLHPGDVPVERQPGLEQPAKGRPRVDPGQQRARGRQAGAAQPLG